MLLVAFTLDGDFDRALKKFLDVEKLYADVTEEQFDLHYYSSKMTFLTTVEAQEVLNIA